ncbi:glycosyltransferase family 2 protein [Paenibacillus sp. WC2504]|uniref:glycosyltransferase family 2 protein n=1 Tax=Paenibacillus sp. WC2504 TaxID=3461403 RepID=UPI004045D3B3
MTGSEGLNLIIGSLAVLVGVMMFWSLPLLQTRKKVNQLPYVSIIIPARNESGRISPLLQSLQNQSFQSFEVLVVDDHSTDHTATIAESFGAKVLQNKAVDSGSGKSMACWHGALHAKGRWLLFLDADTSLMNVESLICLLSFYQQKGAKGILSLQPYHTVHRLYENLSAIFNIIVIVGMNVYSFWGPRFKTAGSFGPCLLCNKEEYLFTGGHQKILGAVLDDLALGQAFMDKNLPVHCMGGKGIVSFRMYPEGIKSLVEGWCKSFAVGSKSTHPFVMLMTIIWISGSFMTTGALISSISANSLTAMILSSTLYLTYVLQTIQFARRCGNFSRYIFLFHPILFLFFSATFVYSLFQTYILRTVKWKGRNIDV